MFILRRYKSEKGGRLQMELVAGLKWNGWLASRGITGRLGLEYAFFHLKSLGCT